MKKLLAAAILLISTVGVHADWVKRNTNSFAWYKDIHFLNDRKGWVAGADGVLLSTVDGGTTWVQNKKFSNDTFLQIQFVNEAEGWLLCERNIFNRGNEPTSYLRRTRDGGETWEKIEFEEAGRQRVTRLLFNSSGAGMAFGEGGIVYNLQEDGTTWKRSQTAMHYLLLDGAYGGGRIGAIVGTGGTIMFTEDSGFTWEKATILGDATTRFSSVAFAASQGAWAVGSRGKIFRSNGGGRLWREQFSGVTDDLTDIFFTSPTNGWAVGEKGVILRTRDGGNNWTESASRTTHRLEKVVFNAGRGWIVGYGGTLLTYDSDGAGPEPSAKPVLLKRG